MKTGGILWYNAVITIRIGVKVMILVSAAIIRNTAGEILICQRGAGGSCAFLWEFPGGKQEAGETAADCLVRECREELGIEIDIVALLEQTSYTYPDNK